MTITGFILVGAGGALIGLIGGLLTGHRLGRRCAEVELAIALNEAIEELRRRAAEQALEKAGLLPDEDAEAVEPKNEMLPEAGEAYETEAYD